MSTVTIPIKTINGDEINMIIDKNIKIFGIENAKEIPEQLNLLNCLTHLILKKNKLSVFPKYMSFYNYNLLVLDISYNNFKTIPQILIYRTSIRNLNISHNEIQELPRHILSKPYIQCYNRRYIKTYTINVSYNKICKLRKKTIENMYYLEIFDISHNNLIKLPKTIKCLTILTVMDISYNNISIIPKEIGQLINLKILNVSHNKIHILPNEIYKLLNLEILNLSYNTIHVLPKEMTNLKKITTLNISHNKVKKYLTWPVNLTDLNLSHNEITIFPYRKKIGRTFNVDCQLKVCDISYNKIVKLTYLIAYIDKIEILNMSHNKISIIPYEIVPCDSDIYGAFLKNLDISFNNLTSIQQPIKFLTGLESLNLSNNNITEIPKRIRHLQQLKILNLSSNQLTVIPREIKYLKLLKILNLSSNRLMVLPKEIKYLKLLKKICLENNNNILYTQNRLKKIK